MDYRATKVNRYWKRPKPRVYECNVRDAERFYQDCYKRYLSDKEDAAARAARARSTEAEHSEFFPHLRAGPLRREASARPAVEPAELPPLPTPLAQAVKSRLSSDAVSTEVSFTGRAEGLPSYDPSKDDTTHEERILRIKRLKEELGLPPDSKPPPVPSISSVKSDASTRSAESGLGEYESSYKSERTSRSLATGGGPDESSSYSFKSERSSRMNGTSGLGERSAGDYKYKADRGSDDYKLSSKSMDFELPKIERKPLNLSPKLERKKNDYSFSTEKKADRFSSLSSAGGSSASSGRKAVADLDIDDDDTSVVDMMKKLPSSQDILERISKMDLDD
ncbi:uncharacterized protein [Panulirus ornatus]|uniref:uncharacterized protein n=1 Tax=Panulirus ornatus TaxID=150431 RepID=UPI003A85B5D6